MTTTTIKRARVALNFMVLSHSDLVTRAYAVHTGMTGNPAFPNPPVNLDKFKTTVDDYAAAVKVALDRGRTAIAERDNFREEVLERMGDLARYVGSVSRDDTAVLLSSGFSPRTLQRSAGIPGQVGILGIQQGQSGELLVRLARVPGAKFYEIRHAELGSNGAPGPWSVTVVMGIRPVPSFRELAPGTTYLFQVRAIGKLGSTEWSDSSTRMCI